MSNYLETESLQRLIKAVHEYQNDLQRNYQILANASSVCDMAMGSDAIAKKHIAKLNEALDELKRTISIAESVESALIRDMNSAIEILED